MRKFCCVLALVPWVGLVVLGQTYVPLMVERVGGVLAAPTNFFGANSNRLNAVVGPPSVSWTSNALVEPAVASLNSGTLPGRLYLEWPDQEQSVRWSVLAAGVMATDGHAAVLSFGGTNLATEPWVSNRIAQATNVGGSGGGFSLTSSDASIIVSVASAGVTNIAAQRTSRVAYASGAVPASNAAALQLFGPVVVSNNPAVAAGSCWVLAADASYLVTNLVAAYISNGVVVFGVSSNGNVVCQNLTNIGVVSAAYFYTPGNVSCVKVITSRVNLSAGYLNAPGDAGGGGLQSTFLGASPTNVFVLNTGPYNNTSATNGVSLLAQCPVSSGRAPMVFSLGDGAQTTNNSGTNLLVGICTNKPQATLHVNGGGWFDGPVALRNVTTGTNDPTMVTNTGLGWVYCKSNSVTAAAEVFVQDGAGNVTQISPHSAAGPALLYDRAPGEENVFHSYNVFSGTNVFINLERQAGLVELLAARFLGELPAEKRTLVVRESAEDFGKRTGVEQLRAVKPTVVAEPSGGQE